MKIFFCLCITFFSTGLSCFGQGDTDRQETLILFLDEPVPGSATKIVTQKVVEHYEGYQRFEERIRKLALKNNGNLAKVEDYHAPDKKHPDHKGMISIYSYPEVESLRKKVEARRDSTDRVYLEAAGVTSLVYIFRPRTSNKTPYNLYIDNKLAKRMKPDSTIILKPATGIPLTLSADTYGNANGVVIRPATGKIYYLECRTVGSTFATFPFFGWVDSHVGRFLFQSIPQNKQ
jgi:hypothetical protein